MRSPTAGPCDRPSSDRGFEKDVRYRGSGALCATCYVRCRSTTPDGNQCRKMTNVLFVCSANRLRSPTAEQVFSTWPGIETDSAGISSGASVLLSSEQVDWADIIFVMEKTHRNKLIRQFRARLRDKRV